MKNLETNFMGIKLSNPIILGASSISSSIEQLQKAELYGAGAVVYKTLFEEQVQLESLQLDEQLSMYDDIHAEMTRIESQIEHSDIDYHLSRLQKTKESLSIPVFASLNAVNKESWIRYAKMIEQTGVDGIEVNLYQTPTNFDITGERIEQRQVDIVKEIKSQVSIPVSVKLSSEYSNVLNFVKKLDDLNVDAFVLFNSFFQPDININKEKHAKAFNLSHKGDYKHSLRYSGMLYGNINADICSNKGIYTGEDAIKLILSGATTIQVVSAIYKHGLERIGEIKKDISEWMDKKGYSSIDEFRGKLSNKNLDTNENTLIYKRAQYIDLLMSSDSIFGDF